MSKQIRVKDFKMKWLDLSIGPVPNRTWLTVDPKDASKGMCTICPDPVGRIGKSFSISEGYTAISSHSEGKKHKSNFSKTQSDPNHNLENMKGPEQVTLEEAVQNMEKKTQAKRLIEAQLLEAQAQWSYSVHSHGIGSEFFDCSSKLFPKMFPDSEIAKLWGTPKKGMGRHKGDYLASFGIMRV